MLWKLFRAAYGERGLETWFGISRVVVACCCFLMKVSKGQSQTETAAAVFVFPYMVLGQQFIIGF